MSFAKLDLPFIEAWLLNNSSREEAIRLAYNLTLECSEWCECDELNTAIITVMDVLEYRKKWSCAEFLRLKELEDDKAFIRSRSRKMSSIRAKATYEFLLARVVRKLYEVLRTQGLNANFWVKIMECIEYSMDIDGSVDIHNVMLNIHPTYTKPGFYDRVVSAIKYYLPRIHLVLIKGRSLKT